MGYIHQWDFKVVSDAVVCYIFYMLKYRLYAFWTRLTFNLTVVKFSITTMRDLNFIEDQLKYLSNPEFLKRIVASLRKSQQLFRKWRKHIYPFVWNTVVRKTIQKTFNLILKIENKIEKLEGKQV